MFLEQKATQVTSQAADAADTLDWLAARYAYPESHEGAFVRANMVQSIDGAVSVDGLSGGLGGPGDRALFRVLRGLTDVVIVGAGTAVAEGYGQPSVDDHFHERRLDANQSSAPVLALVSRSLSIPTDFEPAADPNTVILTCRDAPADRRRALLDAGATLVDCGSRAVAPTRIVGYFVERGLRRLLCEGGPTLLGSMVAADVVDELCLTTSPRIVGGESGRTVHTQSAIAAATSATPAQILTDDDGYVYTRWTLRSAPRSD